jgi:hypothetical protein
MALPRFMSNNVSSAEIDNIDHGRIKVPVGPFLPDHVLALLESHLRSTLSARC